MKHYAENDDVAFVTMQTVFEGFKVNTYERALRELKKYELTIPFAMSGTPEKRSEIMKAYNTGGTPWTVIVDPEGVVRFDGFRIAPKDAIELIDKLKPVEPEKPGLPD